MRSSGKNKRALWYVNAVGETKVYDSNGKFTGEYIKAYSLPKKLMINMLWNTGEETNQPFGSFTDYDRYALTTYNGDENQKPELYTAKLSKQKGFYGQSTKCWFGVKGVKFDNLGEYVYDKNGNKLIHLDSPTYNYEVIIVRENLNELRIGFKEVLVNSK